jgi:hypothetical protein
MGAAGFARSAHLLFNLAFKPRLNKDQQKLNALRMR